MGEQDSWEGNLLLLVGNTQVAKVSGGDHCGEFRIDGRGQVKLQYTMGEVGMSASMRGWGCTTVKAI